MTTADQLLKRKREIDDMVADRFTETQRWLVDAVEYLLQQSYIDALREPEPPS